MPFDESLAKEFAKIKENGGKCLKCGNAITVKQNPNDCSSFLEDAAAWARTVLAAERELQSQNPDVVHMDSLQMQDLCSALLRLIEEGETPQDSG